jgi:alpha-beta hydrolase superfamily lysophospholipase
MPSPDRATEPDVGSRAGLPAASYRSGFGEPLVLLHGINASWRVWKPVLSALEEHHDVFAPSLPGHRGGPPLDLGRPVSIDALADGVERILDAADIDTAHLAGNSLGGWLAIELARRGRARSVVALSPAGGWSSPRDLRRVIRLLSGARGMIAGRHVFGLDHLMRRPRFRRVSLHQAMTHGERIPAREVLEMMDDTALCTAYSGFIEWIRGAAPIRSTRLTCPVRIAWAERDLTIPFDRYGRPLLDALDGAEHITLAGVGHIPMYDDPPLIARAILEVTTRQTNNRSRTLSKSTDITLDGKRGTILVRRWGTSDPQRVVVLVHGLGEHSGRYEHVATRLAADGAIVYAPDHHGHGRSDGERGLVDDLEAMVDDVATVVEKARAEHPGLPVALLGHSLGGVIATRFVQRGEHGLAALVLTGPVVGGNPAFEGLLAMDPIPDVPIDPAVLSRDPVVGEQYANDPLVYHGPLHRETLEQIFAAVDAIGSGPGFGPLPTLWIHGVDDQLAPLDATRPAIEHLRGDQLEELVYPDARHEVLNETNREEVLDEVARFLDDAAAPAPVAAV